VDQHTRMNAGGYWISATMRIAMPKINQTVDFRRGAF
jgi:hypothetical protein